MAIYTFKCKKCEHVFDEICSFSDFDNGFPDVRCEKCNSKSLKKNVISDRPAELVFADPRSSSKWDKWSYRQGKTAEEAKMQRAAAERANRGPLPYKNIDDTNRGRRMNFID